MDLLASGPHIEARLRAKTRAAGDNIFTTADLAGVKEKSQVTPALHLVLHGYQPLSNDGAGDSRWRVIWLVVAVVRNARQNAGAAPIQGDAGALLAETIGALDGWRCPGTSKDMEAIDPPNPLITDGFGYFPLAFAVEVVTDGAEAYQ